MKLYKSSDALTFNLLQYKKKMVLETWQQEVKPKESIHPPLITKTHLAPSSFFLFDDKLIQFYFLILYF